MSSFRSRWGRRVPPARPPPPTGSPHPRRALPPRRPRDSALRPRLVAASELTKPLAVDTAATRSHGQKGDEDDEHSKFQYRSREHVPRCRYRAPPYRALLRSPRQLHLTPLGGRQTPSWTILQQPCRSRCAYRWDVYPERTASLRSLTDNQRLAGSF